MVKDKFKVGEMVIVSQFVGYKETIGITAEFVGMTKNGKYLARLMSKGRYIKKYPAEWKYCFKLTEPVGRDVYCFICDWSGHNTDCDLGDTLWTDFIFPQCGGSVEDE